MIRLLYMRSPTNKVKDHTVPEICEPKPQSEVPTDPPRTDSTTADSGSHGTMEPGTLGRRGVVAVVSGWLVVWLFFLLIGCSNNQFRGHDHWLSGQAMMLAETYAVHDFHTPGFLMMENPTGSQVRWAPYGGWPPGFFLLLAVVLKTVSASLVAGRILSAFFLSGACAITTYLAWRIARSRHALWLTPLVFCANRIVTSYCTLVFCDVPAVTWCVLLLALFPVYLRTEKMWVQILYILGIVGGALTSWQCYMVAPACAVLCWIHFPRLARSRLSRIIFPVLVCVAVGLFLILRMRGLEQIYPPNSWFPPDANNIAGKFLKRSTFGNPGEAFWNIGNFVYLVGVFSSTSLLLTFAIHMLGQWLPVWVPSLGSGAQNEGRQSDCEEMFYHHGLLLIPALWLLTMAEMHHHEFQVLFWVPFLSVSIVSFLLPLIEGASTPQGKKMWCALLAGSFAWAVLWHVPKKVTEDDSKAASMARAVHDLTSPDTVVVTTCNDRGLWWRLDRPVVGWNRAPEVRRKNHVILVEFDPATDTSWKGSYTIAHTVCNQAQPYDGYTILRPIEITRAMEHPESLESGDIRVTHPPGSESEERSSVPSGR